MSTFIMAHQDDWQLCMADAAYDALMNANQSKVLFIYLTAGDAGSSDIRHYQGREEGARASVRHILQNICKYQHAEVQVMQTAIEVLARYNIKPVALIHDAIVVRNKLSVDLREEIRCAIQSSTGNKFWSLKPTQLDGFRY